MIEIKNLNVFYKDKKLLHELDFAMSEGKFIGITGASGSGKSLFAKSLIRLFDDDFRVRADKFSIYKKDILKLKLFETFLSLIFTHFPLNLAAHLSSAKFHH